MTMRLTGPGLILVLAAALFFAGCHPASDDDDAFDFPDDAADDSVSDDAADDAADDATDDAADDGGDDDSYWFGHLLPGPDEDGYNPTLEAIARMYDRQFHVFNALGTGLSCDVMIPYEPAGNRDLVTGFLRETDGWDFEAYSGMAVFDVVTEYQKVAGLYSGVGIAADAYRYGVLRDQGYDESETARARDHLLAALDQLHVATAITGVPGVIARGFNRTDIPGNAGSQELTPLFDGDGNPLPPEKSNGTWRADNSGGLYPNYIWEDSCSRDQYIGWMTAFAASWEVIKDDPAFPDDLKAQMKEDAREIGLQLKVVRPSGFDLEIIDADGRTTYHGYMNENNYDRHYLPFLPVKDGMYALMALGSVAALNYVAQDPELTSYLYDTLIGERHLDLIARDNQVGVDLWVQSNYSSINMAFQGAVLAFRYLEDDLARENIRYALQYKLYDKPGWPRQPSEIGQSLFDFIFASGVAGSTAFEDMSGPPPADAVRRGVNTLLEFPEPPFYEFELINCDEAEIQSGRCVLNDGTEVVLLGYVGRGDKLVSRQPVPMRTRPSSNYHWRTNPYEVNGGGNTGRMVPGVDFRYAYWLGRWSR